MGRLVVVSNRVALPGETATGGLANGLRSALRKRRGLWFGWSGEVVERVGEAATACEGGIEYLLTDLSATEHERYYLGFSNRILWPLCHYRPSLLDYSRPDFIGYWDVNRRLAQLLAPRLVHDDTLWVHDYHLLPLGQELREAGIGVRSGFFLHVPFPPSPLVEMLPHHELLFSALASYDLIGVQTADDAQCLRTYLEGIGGVSGDDGSVRMPDGRLTRVKAFSIGIDAAAVAEKAERAPLSDEFRRLDASLEGRKLVIGVDRLDYSKGLPQRFEAFGRFLGRHEHWRARVSYLQIAPPSREDLPEYRDLQHQLEQLAGATNGQFADPHWVPIRYVNRSYSHDVLAGYYRMADVGLVTPLRDGMNLVAKEFIAAQPPEDPGVLVLSCFAGAARELDGALVINPVDQEDIVETLHKALEMPLHDRKARWQALWKQVCTNTIDTWSNGFLAELEGAPQRSREPDRTAA